jgi:hypothetical protein
LINKSRYDLIEFYGDEYWLLLWGLKKIKKTCPLLGRHMLDGLELYDKGKRTPLLEKTGRYKKMAVPL